MMIETAALVALAGLSHAGPARIRWLLRSGSAPEVVDHLRAGRLPVVDRPAPRGVTEKLIRSWTAELREVDLAGCLEPYRRSGIQVLAADHPLWPFHRDPDPPVVLFAQGRAGLLPDLEPSVAVIGTRRCTAIGRRVAEDLGRSLAEAGVIVVSGLATGIDGAAHHGALCAGGDVVGVVGTGLDVVYPRANRALWRDVADRGVLLSEAVLGTGGDRWRFPARNRLIAGLADVVVVVESHSRGGSLHTVDEALTRDRPVMAVPGAVTNPAAAGTNRLLIDGATPACSADDVLALLGIGVRPSPVEPVALVVPLDAARRSRSRPGDTGEETDDGARGRRGNEAGPPPSDPVARAVLAELAAGSAHVDHLVTTTGRPVAVVLAAVDRLDRQGWVTVHGSTVERTESHGRPPGGNYPHRP